MNGFDDAFTSHCRNEGKQLVEEEKSRSFKVRV